MGAQTQFSPRIIGSGNPGFKTQDLIKFAGRIEALDVQRGGQKLNLRLPKSAAVTPELCRKFEKEAGCNENDTPASAKEKMLNCKSGEFEDAIGEVYRFHHRQNFSTPFATRSDDYGATGVLSTSFVWVNTNNPDAGQIKNIRASSINVLASGFSENAKQMARIFAKWGSIGTGILVNPYYGKEIAMDFSGGMKSGPAYSLAYLAPLENSEYSVWQASRGMAVIPKDATIRYDTKRFTTDNDIHSLPVVLGQAQFYPIVGLGCKGWLPEPASFMPTFGSKVEDETIEKVAILLESAMQKIRKGGRLYAELVCEQGKNIYDWVVLQMSGMEWANFTEPRTRIGNDWARSSKVMGFADRITEGVCFSNGKPGPEMKKYNSGHRGYLLIIDVNTLTDFEENWKIRQYGNAGAVAFIAKELYNPVQSHVGGLLRMLDIPMLAFENGRGEANMLRALGKDAKVKVVVDETGSVGGIIKI